MEYFLFYIGPSLVLFIQLFLCIKSSNKIIKVSPALLLIFAIGVCVYIYLTDNSNHIFFGGNFVAFIYGLLFTIALFVDGIAWAFYYVYKFIKKDKIDSEE